MQLKKSILPLATAFVSLLGLTACEREIINGPELNDPALGNTAGPTSADSRPILLAIDEQSIDNGNAPNGFSDRDVNDNIARIGQRATLRYFKNNIGKTIVLHTGEVGDEGWHALKTIPDSWRKAGPTANGAANYIAAGPGLGSGSDAEKWLDKIPGVTPLRATALRMLVGQTILAVVYDGDVSINFSPLNGSLKGENLGLVALQITQVTRRLGGSSGSLPAVSVKIMDADSIKAGSLYLFSNAPAPRSSSEPYDINPPVSVAAIALVKAN